MNQNKIITISRQYGSGGRIIGKKLAEALGIPFYDNELITMAAEKTGLSVECFKDAEKTSVGNLFFSLTSLTPSIDSVGLPLNEKIFLVQSQVIKEVAEEGPALLLVVPQTMCCPKTPTASIFSCRRICPTAWSVPSIPITTTLRAQNPW